MKSAMTTLFAISTISLVTSCSSMNKWGVDSTSNVLYDLSSSVSSQTNFDFVREGMGANLFLIEGLSANSPKNENLLAALTKGFASYAFIVNETELMEEKLKNFTADEIKRQTILNYSKSISYGLKYLEQNGINYKDLVFKMYDRYGIYGIFEEKLNYRDKKDIEVVFYTAQSLTKLAILRPEDQVLKEELLITKEMFDWVCQKEPSFEYGMCDLYYANIVLNDLERNPDKIKEAKSIYNRAMENHPHNWMIQMSFLEKFINTSSQDEDFIMHMKKMEIQAEEYKKQFVFEPQKDNSKSWIQESNLRIYQALAVKRFEILQKYKKQI